MVHSNSSAGVHYRMYVYITICVAQCSLITGLFCYRTGNNIWDCSDTSCAQRQNTDSSLFADKIGHRESINMHRYGEWEENPQKQWRNRNFASSIYLLHFVNENTSLNAGRIIMQWCGAHQRVCFLINTCAHILPNCKRIVLLSCDVSYSAWSSWWPWVRRRRVSFPATLSSWTWGQLPLIGGSAGGYEQHGLDLCRNISSNTPPAKHAVHAYSWSRYDVAFIFSAIMHARQNLRNVVRTTAKRLHNCMSVS